MADVALTVNISGSASFMRTKIVETEAEVEQWKLSSRYSVFSLNI